MASYAFVEERNVGKGHDHLDRLRGTRFRRGNSHFDHPSDIQNTYQKGLADE